MDKNFKAVLVGAGIILAVGILFWLGRGNIGVKNSANLPAAVVSDLISDQTQYDFGTISMAAGTVSHDFKIKNTGREPVKTDKLYTSCMCTTAKFIQDGKSVGPFGMPGHGFVPPFRKTIAPGEEVVISVDFDPAAHGPAGVGEIEREIYLEGDSGPLVTLGIKANVTP
jgi:hypothetical protein